MLKVGELVKVNGLVDDAIIIFYYLLLSEDSPNHSFNLHIFYDVTIFRKKYNFKLANMYKAYHKAVKIY
jgi:hypothetical protein